MGDKLTFTVFLLPESKLDDLTFRINKLGGGYIQTALKSDASTWIGLDRCKKHFVKDAGGDILWSWHIWVTDSDLTCRTVTNTGGTFSKGVMPLNLGWVDLSTSTGYERKKLQIRFVQIANGVVKNEVAKNPERREYVTENPAGQSPTYQWGRKDPFIRFKDDASELTTSEYSGTGLSFDGGAGAATPISSTIKNPTQFFYKDAWRQGGGKYINLWSVTLTSTTAGGEGYTSAPVKTVYDPCRPGFQVPQMNAFDRWDYSGSGGEWNYGYKLKTSASGNDSFFFPATGFRNGESFYATAVWYKEYYSSPKSRYWMAAPNDGTGNRFYAYQLLIDKDAMGINYAEYKSSGLSIRPVQEASGKF